MTQIKLFTTEFRLFPLVVLLLGACSTTSPRLDYIEQADQEIQQVPTWNQLDSAQQVSTLNDLLSAPELDELIEQAHASNPNLQSTLLTLDIVRAQSRQSGADRLPTVEAGFSAARTEDSDSSYTGSISVNWELDLWRKMANEVKAADLDIAEQEALTQSARDYLTAEVMLAWLELISTQRNLDIEHRRLQTRQKNEQFIIQRYRNGLGTLEDIDDARSSTSSTRADMEALQETDRQQRRALRTLLGKTRQIVLQPPSEYPLVTLPLADLPEQNLQRRPDLKAAYLAIASADARATATYRDLLPSISLSAALQDIGDSPSSALLNNPIWSLLAQLTAPLYQGGEKRAAAEIADLNVAIAYEDYRDTLLTAVNEVEDTLGLESSLARRQTHIESALSHAGNNLAQYQQSYRSGLVDILDLLTVEQATYDLEAQLENIIYQRLANRVKLGLALGLGARK